jgi:hypothetical protein
VFPAQVLPGSWRLARALLAGRQLHRPELVEASEQSLAVLLPEWPAVQTNRRLSEA